MYSANNPISLLDIGGKDIIVLLDKEGANGAGHSAVLIGRDYDPKTKTGGWHLYSKNGGDLWILGPSKAEKDDFKTLQEFDENVKQDIYEEGYKIKTSQEEDQIMKEVANEQLNEWYWLLGNSCMDTSRDCLNAIFKDPGSMKGIGMSPIPNVRYEQLKSNNKGQQIIFNENFPFE